MSKIVYAVDKEFLQSVAESNCGRELTIKELKRASLEFLQNEELVDAVYGGLISVAREVMKKDGSWDEMDKYYKNKTLDELYKDIIE
jgi:hypothetical protein